MRCGAVAHIFRPTRHDGQNPRPLQLNATSLVSLHVSVQRMNGGDLPPKVRNFAEAQWKRPALAKFLALPRPPFVPY